MQANDIGEIIARFIGFFEIATESQRSRDRYEDFLARTTRHGPFVDGNHAAAKMPPFAETPLFKPVADLQPVNFSLAHVALGRLGGDGLELTVPDVGHGRAGGPALPHRLPAALPLMSASPHILLPPDGDVRYGHVAPSGIIDIRQVTTLYESDIFSGDGSVPASAEDGTVLSGFLAEAEAWATTPTQTSDLPTLETMLTVALDPGAESTAMAPAFEGVYVNGAAASPAPDLRGLIGSTLAAQNAADPLATGDPGSAMATLGGNVLFNQAVMIQAGQLANTTVVMGDYHETNSIRQLNIHTDQIIPIATVGSFGGNQPFNIASFSRIDPTSGHAAPPLVFPLHYTVDVVEGDVLVSNFVRQMHSVIDNDWTMFTSVDHSAQISTGANHVLNFAKLSDIGLGYDLVIFGGNTFEGNFIEQINIMVDSDRLMGSGPQPLSASTGGNLLFNHASITNVGGTEGFDPVDPAIRELMASFDARDGHVASALSMDLAFLGSSNLKILYITGDYIEINSISQINVLSDSDSVGITEPLVESLLQSGGSSNWTVSSGNNLLGNHAAIFDVDAAGHRQLGGSYYSDSVLLQADLVSGADGIEVFDTSALASELVAFAGDGGDDPGGDGQHLHGMHSGYDAPVDGVGNILT